MEYRPRYPQPFTLGQALGLDVSVITEGSHAPTVVAASWT